MTSRIRILDDALVDQIAAGEVIERPANLVKELLENAIDANAKTIAVEIEHGGLSLIRVTDDGTGMSSADLAMSLKRHATSKLNSADDLVRISTLGFRGEALPSIASVSRFTITSRTKDTLSGTTIGIDGGSEVENSETGCAPGTIVEARDLFYNVPARRKFLKSQATESAHITTACQRAVLAFPYLRLSLIRDGRTVLEFVPAASFIERTAALFPKEKLIPVTKCQDDIEITAALGAPERARSGSNNLYIFVNNRPVRDTALARSVMYAYGSVLPTGRQPIGGVSIKIPPDQVDVNVHPQKLEVRFAKSGLVLDTITRLIAQELGTAAWSGPRARSAAYLSTPTTDASSAAFQSADDVSHTLSDNRENGTETQQPLQRDPWGLYGEPENKKNGLADSRDSRDSHRPQNYPSQDRVASTSDRNTELFVQKGFFGSLRVLGQVRRLFLVCEGHDALYIIDQHASDERVRFNQLQKNYHSRTIRTQQLLFPEQLNCSELEISFIDEHKSEIDRLGFDCDRVGPTTVAIRSVPALLGRAAPEQIFRDLLTELTHSGDRVFADSVDRALATMACHGAIRAGDSLSIEEAEALLKSMDKVDNFASHCPHGRPVVYSIHLDQLERKLGR